MSEYLGFWVMLLAVAIVAVIVGTLYDWLYEAPRLRERRRWVHTRWYNRR